VNQNLVMIQGPHCLLDFRIKGPLLEQIDIDYAVNLVNELIFALKMKKKCDPRIIKGNDRKLSIYQVVSTSHIILHFGTDGVIADLFSCEPYDVGRCVGLLTQRFGLDVIIQYCQRNLIHTPSNSPPIPMGHMNALTSNPKTFTHALINWFDGDGAVLGNIEKGSNILKDATDILLEESEAQLPPSGVLLLDVEPVAKSWDQGGFSGGYVNLMKQLTMHTFLGINAAYTDIMGYTYDLEAIIKVIKKGFGFSFYEIDGIFQRMKAE